MTRLALLLHSLAIISYCQNGTSIQGSPTLSSGPPAPAAQPTAQIVRGPTATTNTSSFTTSVNQSVDGKINWMVLGLSSYSSTRRSMEPLRWTSTGHPIYEHNCRSDTSSHSRSNTTSSFILFAISNWTAKCRACNQQKLEISQRFLVGSFQRCLSGRGRCKR